MVTQKETSKNEKEIYIMGIIATLLVLAILWVGAGVLVTYVQSKERKLPFKFNWNKIFTWPEIFKK
jgi:hypothetical protein